MKGLGLGLEVKGGEVKGGEVKGGEVKGEGKGGVCEKTKVLCLS